MLPGEKLVIELEELLKRLKSAEYSLTRTNGLREAKGRDCPFYCKSLKLFLESDYLELSSMIKSLYHLIQEIEEDNG